MQVKIRFAPSPTGPLHLGHAYSALLAEKLAQREKGVFKLRIEDIDRERSRSDWEQQIYEDLSWLGIRWHKTVRHQSDHLNDYQNVISKLASQGLLYPCSCSRADIRAALSGPQEGAPLLGPDGVVYPGTCRDRTLNDRRPEDALRLNMRKAIDALGDIKTLYFRDLGPNFNGTHHVSADWLIHRAGDVVLSRRINGEPAYLIASTWDDAEQQISLVPRGEDLFEATYVQRLLQALLNIPTPDYYHHKLIRDEKGKRLAKRDDARAIRNYRKEGFAPEDVLRMIGPI